jgi:hypothetical protein
MREAINTNPVVQLSVIGGLLLVVGFIFLMGPMKKKSSEPPATQTTSAELTGPQGSVDITVESTPAPGAPAPAVPGSAGAPVAPGSVTEEALVPGPGLPAEVVSAWQGGDAVVLYIEKTGAVDDRLVRSSVATLTRRPGVSVFVAPAKDVADYSRITQPLSVNRVPALVVIRPKKVSGAAPQALVVYGFRNSESVVQAVDDALYQGKENGPYHPG